MSSKFELSIDVGYVKSWGIVEAVREFFQNSYDEEKQNPDNKSYFNYDKDSCILTIGNKLSILKSETLLLGCTSKENDNGTIGQFGEGYKIATVVALRTGHNVTFYNYGAREVWTTRLVKSKKYNGRLVPTFFIDKKFEWKSFFSSKSEEKNLQIEITNVTEDEYNDILNSNINLKPLTNNVIHTSFGTIIFPDDGDTSGKIYVSGLYVCDGENLKYNYDINPEYLKLDRDRMAVNSFDLKWMTSRMWVYAVATDCANCDLLFDLLDNEKDTQYSDAVYANSFITGEWEWGYNQESIAERLYLSFVLKYGKDSVPVNSNSLRDKLEKCGNKTIFVGETMYNILGSYKGNDISVIKEKTLYSRYKELLESLKQFMTEDQIEETNNLLEESMFILGGEDN